MLKIKIHIHSLLICTAMALFIICGCEQKADSTKSQGQAAAKTFEDQPIADYQGRLLTIAFDSVSKMPLEPHIKNRSRAQERVVEACLELNQPVRADEYTRDIANWRKGLCYAHLAVYCARNGFDTKAKAYLDLAAPYAEQDGLEKWRRDRIKVRMAQAYAVLGYVEKQKQYNTGLEESEAGKVAETRAAYLTDLSFEEEVEKLDALIATENFDAVKNALEAYGHLYNRYYSDEKRRTTIENRIKESWSPLPFFIRIDLLLSLSQYSIDHADFSKALLLLDEADIFLEEMPKYSEDTVYYMARFAKLRFLAGDIETARALADDAKSLYEQERLEIINMYRGRPLRTLAEAYQAMKDNASAMAVYKTAVEEGIENPNSRPRSQDLSATCISMAVNMIEPDDELWGRIHAINEELGQPW